MNKDILRDTIKKHYGVDIKNKIINRITMLDKILHHVLFTIFWTLVILVVITSFMRLKQWDDGQIQDCVDRGYSYERCVLSY